MTANLGRFKIDVKLLIGKGQGEVDEYKHILVVE